MVFRLSGANIFFIILSPACQFYFSKWTRLQKNDYNILEYPDFGSLDLVPVRQSVGFNSEENIRIIKQIDFYFTNGDVGIIYIFIKRDFASEIRSNLAFGTLFISLFLIIILGVFNSLFIYRSISKPLVSLVEGVKKMKGQNYDFEFDTSRRDEISILAESFEELRIEMLANKKMRHGYEKDRKEFIRSIIESSNPSFGRFMTEVFSHYQGLRESGKQSTIKVTDRSAILKLLRKSANELNAEELDQSRILELCTLAYRLSRASAA